MLGFYVRDGDQIASGEKAAVVTPTERDDLTGPRILVVRDGDEAAAVGIVQFAPPRQITDREFKVLSPEHGITEAQRHQWWPDQSTFFYHCITHYYPLARPQPVDFEPGTNMNLAAPLSTKVIGKRRLSSGGKVYVLGVDVKQGGHFVTLGEGGDRRIVFIEGPGQGRGGVTRREVPVESGQIAGLSEEQSVAVREAQAIVKGLYDGRASTLEVRSEPTDSFAAAHYRGTHIAVHPENFSDDLLTDRREEDIRRNTRWVEEYRKDLELAEGQSWASETYLDTLRKRIEKIERHIEEDKGRPAWAACESMRDVVLHEYGHAIHGDVKFGDIVGISEQWGAPSELRERGIKWEESIPYKLEVFARQNGGTISEYAMTNGGEYFAEAFVRYVQGRADEIEFEPVRDVFERLFE